MGIFVGVIVGAGITLAGSIASLAGLIITNHTGTTGVNNSTVSGGISSHEAIFDMSGQGNIGMWFLECIAVVFLLSFCMCGGFHCCKWTKHCHGAHRAWKNHEEAERWEQIEQHFMAKFENLAGNGSPAIEVEMPSEDMDRNVSTGEGSEPSVMMRDESSSPILESMANVCDQSTQVYTCGRGMRQPCLASVVKEV